MSIKPISEQYLAQYVQPSEGKSREDQRIEPSIDNPKTLNPTKLPRPLRAHFELVKDGWPDDKPRYVNVGYPRA